MERQHLRTAVIVAALVQFALVGCGGGGGGDSGPSSPAPAPTPAAVTYSVGGSVSGLAGTGLAIASHGENLSINGNGTFAFTQRLASGASFQVAISSQPASPAQTCAATNATGVIGNADVANVSIACTTNPAPPAATYSIGGAVTGLTGTGLVLSSNGENLNINGNGAFAFTQRLASGASFQVAIVNQPVSPAQTCAVTNGMGTIGSAPVSNIVVACQSVKYTLGGTVRGMQGTGLILTDGYNARVTVDANGSFVFPVLFEPNTFYGMSIERQPGGAVQCRVVDSTRSGFINGNVTSVAIECDRTRLPPSLRYCEFDCPAEPPAIVKLCPAGQPACQPTRSTRVYMRVDGHAISGGLILVNGLNTGTLSLVSGNAEVIGNVISMWYAPYVELRSDANVTLTHYTLPPVWGGATNVDLQSTYASGGGMSAMFYRHVSYQPDVSVEDVLSQALAVIAAERQIVGRMSDPIYAFFMPTELVTVSEGNVSYGDGIVTINYGNPPYIASLGGVMAASIPRFAHEHAHELFDEIRPQYAVESLCLNEGAADALGFLSGYMPEQDFGPQGLAGINFDTDSCLAATEQHDIGNCPLWQIKRHNLLTNGFIRGLFHPQHAFAFDSCKLSELRTGNSLLVLFTEAAGGADVRPALDAANIPHAPTYEAALQALGF